MVERNLAGEGAFGALLRHHRTGANLTQSDLAERSGMSVQAIGALERGDRRSPRPSTLECLAGALRLDAQQRDAFIAAARGQLVTVAASSDVGSPEGQPVEPPAGIPPNPVADFIGREAELTELGERLEEGGRLAVHGLGGVGKTQLVAHYLHRRRTMYEDGVFWLRADEECSLVDDLAGLASHMNLPERQEPRRERQVAAVLRWLREHERWLLVLDNVELPAGKAMEHWLPAGLPGHVLLTSRSPMWSAQLRLRPLPIETATELLLKRTGLGDAEAARSVAEELGGLPLALTQAAAYLDATGRDLTSYAELLRTRLVELMSDMRPDDYPDLVATTWHLSFERLEDECPPASDLLHLCAFLAPDDIPISALQAGAHVMPQRLRDALADDLKLDRTIAALRRYSLVERQGDALSVHRLVQAIVRETLDVGKRREWLGAAIRVVRVAFPEPLEYPERWPLSARLIAHARLVERLTGGATVEPDELGEVLHRAGAYLWTRGELDPARALMERSLTIREQVAGSEHPDTAHLLIDVGALLQSQGQPGPARRFLERALDICERVLGPGDLLTATCLTYLARALWSLDQLALARRLAERALAINERQLGLHHRQTANTLGLLATLLEAQGDIRPAMEMAGRTLAIYERIFGPENQWTANSLSTLARLLQTQGDLAAARPLAERALAIHRRVLGSDHYWTANSMVALAAILSAQGERAAARPLLEQALTIRERALGSEHPGTVGARRRLQETAGLP